MLKIKLARFGKRHQPMFRIVVNEARDKRDGKYVEAIGQYAPTLSPKILTLDLNAYDAWVKKGAQPTETVAALADRVRNGKPFVKKTKLSAKAKAKLAQPASEEAPAEAVEAPVAEEATPEVTETPTEETAVETPATEETKA